jgi:hypothetical protein
MSKSRKSTEATASHACGLAEMTKWNKVCNYSF